MSLGLGHLPGRSQRVESSAVVVGEIRMSGLPTLRRNGREREIGGLR